MCLIAEYSLEENKSKTWIQSLILLFCESLQWWNPQNIRTWRRCLAKEIIQFSSHLSSMTKERDQIFEHEDSIKPYSINTLPPSCTPQNHAYDEMLIFPIINSNEIEKWKIIVCSAPYTYKISITDIQSLWICNLRWKKLESTTHCCEYLFYFLQTNSSFLLLFVLLYLTFQ